MAVAAVPKNIGHDFTSAPPGHRFGLYFEGWNVNGWTLDKEDRDNSQTGKTAALRRVLPIAKDAQQLAESIRNRQQAIVSVRSTAGLSLPAISTAPFMTGLGCEHPLENGFAFLNPYGIPYLPGAGIKGIVLRAAVKLAKGEFPEGTQGWTDDTVKALFGVASENADEDVAGSAGALCFWDAIPALKDKLALEIMTPHYARYYEGSESPHDSGQPNPIPLLAVPVGTQFTFHVTCETGRLDSGLIDQWRTLVEAALVFAFDWLGFGAKTSVGYGQFSVDVKAQRDIEESARLRAEQAAQAARLAESVRGLSPTGARLATEATNGNWQTDKSRFVASGLIESWLDQLEAGPQADAINRLSILVETHFPKLLENPDAVQGKKQKPVFTDRQKAIAQRLIALRKSNGRS